MLVSFRTAFAFHWLSRLIQSWALLPLMIQSSVASPRVPCMLRSRAQGGVGLLLLDFCFSSQPRLFLFWAPLPWMIQSWVASPHVPWMLQSRAPGSVCLFPHGL